MSQDKRDEEMWRMRLAGATYAEIGTKLGLTRQRVYQVLSPPKAVRDEVIKRAAGFCQSCRIKVGTRGHVHHGKPGSKDGDWFKSPERLVLLCASCHNRAHPGKGDVASIRIRVIKEPQDRQKRWTRGAMLAHLLEARAITATSRQMGHGPEWLGRVLRHDPEGVLSRGEAQAILDACDAVADGVPI